MTHIAIVHAANLRQDGKSWDELSRLSQWVTWRTEERKGKPTKVPYSPHGGKAEADSPSTWSDRPRAEAHAAESGAEGVGIMLGAVDAAWAVGGIDLDSCRDSVTGALEPWAVETIRRFKTYAEVSPSGTGVKIFFLYSLSYLPSLHEVMGGAKHGKKFSREGDTHPPSIEIYLSNRYFTVTGERIEGVPADLHKAFLGDLLHIIQVAGPAFVGKGAPAAATPLLDATAEPKSEAPEAPLLDGDLWSRISRSAHWHPNLGRLLAGDFAHLADRSRSGRAMAFGCALARANYSFEDMVEALRTWPHTAAWATEKGDAANGREFRRIWEKAITPNSAPADDEPQTIKVGDREYPLNEDGLAQAFANRFRDLLRFCHHAGAWFQWSGAIWEQEETSLAFHWARELCRSLGTEAEVKPGVRNSLAKASTAAAVERYARADRAFAVTSSHWNRDTFLLGTPGGTVNLHTGILAEPRPEDHITKATAVAPAERAECPAWLGFLADATAGDNALVAFLQQFCGYLLTGDTREHALVFVYGPGGNGKSVFLNTIAGILHDYARTAAMDSLTASSSDRHPTDLAMLRGARMVSASETEEGRPWAEARIKQLTGGDPITARFMRQDFFTYLPEFKLVVIGNHKPVLRNADEAARRRFNVVPFTNQPSTPDRELEQKLRAEWPGILRWMIEGCLSWQRDGLVRPQVVLEATAEYFTEQDSVRQWIDECCETGGRNIYDTVENLFKSWTAYALAAGEKPMSARWLSQTLQRHGCEPVVRTPANRQRRGFLRISVKNVDTSTQWQNREDG